MKPKKISSMPGLFGSTDYYDANGNHIGYNIPGIVGGTDYYDTM